MDKVFLAGPTVLVTVVRVVLAEDCWITGLFEIFDEKDDGCYCCDFVKSIFYFTLKEVPDDELIMTFDVPDAEARLPDPLLPADGLTTRTNCICTR